MFRIYRCKVNEVDPRVIEIGKYYDEWEKELTSQLGASIVGNLALPKLEADRQHVSYYTNFRGEVDQVTPKNIEHYRSQFENGRDSLNVIMEFLDSDKELNDILLESQRKDLYDLINDSDIDFVINNKTVVSVACKATGYIESDYHYAKERMLHPEKDTESKAVPPVPPIPPKKGGCLLPFLLGLLGLLLLLALLALLWWYFLRPWPFSEDPFAKSVEPQTTAVATEPVKEDPVPVEPEPTSEDDENAVPTDEEKQALEQAKEEELRKAKEAEDLKAKEDAEAKAKAEAEQKAKAEAERKAKEEAEKKAKAEAERKALESKNKIPKCKTLKEQGTMPQMAIAFDGSESMTIPYGSTSRLGAAKNAAVNLINATDKNVSIGLVEVNGCPAAKNRGFFSGSARNSLIASVNRIDPYRYDGKTPLVNGLNQLATMLDGVNAEAVGILISDGEDTCPFTGNMNLCNVAANIHRAKPKLTIHTILIGDSIDSAACIANITGGKVFKPRDAIQIQQFIKEAGAKLKKVCE